MVPVYIRGHYSVAERPKRVSRVKTVAKRDTFCVTNIQASLYVIKPLVLGKKCVRSFLCDTKGQTVEEENDWENTEKVGRKQRKEKEKR